MQRASHLGAHLLTVGQLQLVPIRVEQKCPISLGFPGVLRLSFELSAGAGALAQLVELLAAVARDTEVGDSPQPDFVLIGLDQHERERTPQIAQPDDSVTGLPAQVHDLEVSEIAVEVDASEGVPDGQGDVAETAVHASAIGI